MTELNKNIKIIGKIKTHTKATESYTSVRFHYGDKVWDGWVPVEYRRTGVFIKDEELNNYLNNIYFQMHPNNFNSWLENERKFWREEKPRAEVTKAFFDRLVEGGWECQLKWHCVNCKLPQNPNFARRIQELKELGYTLATDTNRNCSHCNAKKTHIILLPIARCGCGNGYETWSSTLRKRIIKVLGGKDVYESKPNPHCLPDHKFPEIRWDSETKTVNDDMMTDKEICDKFQLLTNQRNQQKREICRACFQTGKRGVIYGIPFFYRGGENWDETIVTRGKEAERGCVGCPWYDIEEWRKQLLAKLQK